MVVEIHARRFYIITKNEMQTQLEEENMMHYKIHNVNYLITYDTMKIQNHKLKISGPGL